MSVKKTIRFGLISLACFIIISISFVNAKKKHRDESVLFLPEVKALTVSGDSLKFRDVCDTTKRTSILFFGPDCEFCQKEIEGIIERNGECRDVQWIFITIAQPEELEPFLKEYPIESIPSAFLLREDFPEMHIRFDVSAPPALFIYDEQGNLMKMHRGATSIRTIVAELK